LLRPGLDNGIHGREVGIVVQSFPLERQCNSIPLWSHRAVAAAPDRDVFLQTPRTALLAITEPRFFGTERGYQGALIAELQQRLADVRLPGDPIVEQEYQKRISAHGIRIRPDIIMHVPFERDGVPSRKHWNLVAIASSCVGRNAMRERTSRACVNFGRNLGIRLRSF
jgi:hypothetical protein